MPVRKIPKTSKSVRGQFPSVKNNRSIGFESTLERDFYLGLEFDPTIKSYEEQPIRLTGTIDGKKVVYVPDCLITYSDGKPKVLAEVKRAEEIANGATGLLMRLELARQYAEEQGIEFKVFTESEIQSPSLGTRRFIYGFSSPPRDLEARKGDILTIVSAAGELSLKDLLQKLSDDKAVRARFSPIIWHLLFTGELVADLDLPISYSTVLRIPYEHSLS